VWQTGAKDIVPVIEQLRAKSIFQSTCPMALDENACVSSIVDFFCLQVTLVFPEFSGEDVGRDRRAFTPFGRTAGN
jgi:hypothetical protein